MRLCARCQVRVVDIKDPLAHAGDYVAFKEGEAEILAGWDEVGEPLCEECLDKGPLIIEDEP